jgi:CRISPR/Cas system CMR subunit Cmr4 (Cas7 group RAMP superfamily)
MSRRIHGLFLPLVFPAGIAPGEGGDYNILAIARNGRGQPVLRGSALAGALRHAWAKHRQRDPAETDIEDEVRRFFGYALRDDAQETREECAIPESECVLEVGAASP